MKDSVSENNSVETSEFNPNKPITEDSLHKAALKAIKATNYCTKHSLYHGQKYKSCTPQERVLIELTKENK